MWFMLLCFFFKFWKLASLELTVHRKVCITAKVFIYFVFVYNDRINIILSCAVMVADTWGQKHFRTRYKNTFCLLHIKLCWRDVPASVWMYGAACRAAKRCIITVFCFNNYDGWIRFEIPLKVHRDMAHTAAWCKRVACSSDPLSEHTYLHFGIILICKMLP